MKKITKLNFIELHRAGKLKLIIIGMAQKEKSKILDHLKIIGDKIDEYARHVTNCGNIESDKNGYQTCQIYLSDCGNFIFVETKIDNSKNPLCSRTNVELYNTVYLCHQKEKSPKWGI